MSLVRVNAGKVLYDEATKKCTPLPHRGVITIRPSADEESFFDFKWSPKSSQSGNIEVDDLLIIPGDVTFKQIKSCTTGRVLALTFLSSGAKHLYWLQDVGEGDDESELAKLTEKDALVLKKVNALISLSEDDEDEADDSEEEDSAAAATDAQGQSVEDHTVGDSTKSQETVTEPSHSASAAPAGPAAARLKSPIFSLSDVLTPDVIDAHLSQLTEEQLRERYAEYLPENTNPTKHEILEVLRSGFYSQASKKLSEQLRESNGTGYLLAQTLKFDYQGEGIENFVNGVRSIGQQSGDSKAPTKKEEEEGDDMKQD